jgi:hypothetical protein
MLKGNNFKELKQKDKNICSNLQNWRNQLGILTLIASSILSSLSTRREGEEGECKCLNIRY